MQALLSRASQAHRCGCRACSTAVNTLGRRPTVARRKPTFAELFTAAYSSVFASAAIIDAVRKDERRRELDGQLEQARQELNDLRTHGLPDTQAGHGSDAIDERQMDSLWKSLKQIYHNRPYMKEVHQPAVVTASELIDTLRHEHYGSPSLDAMKANRRTDYEKLERAIAREQSIANDLICEAQTRKHLAKDTAAVEKMIGQLLDRVAVMSNDASAPSYDEARTLAKQSSPQYTFSSIDRRGAEQNSRSLNDRLRSILESSDMNLREKVGRVCYNLFISAHPPDMHTYNTLIVAFDKGGNHALSDTLVHSFFFDRLLKPTPSTYVAILNHYRNTNNHGQFLRALACVAGADKITGGKIRRRHVADVVEHPSMHAWAADTKRRTVGGNWVYEHVPLHQPLVEEVIKGLLHFQLFDQAASFFISCMNTGVAISARVVRQVLDDCIYALDWKGAVQLVRGFSHHQQRLRAMLADDSDGTSAYLVDRLYVLLDLCGLSVTGPQASKQLLKNLQISERKLNQLIETLSHVNVSPLTLLDGEVFAQPSVARRSKSNLLRLESIWKEYVSVRKTTASIESKLLNSRFSQEFRQSMAQHIGHDACVRSRQLIEEFEALVPTSTMQHDGSEDLHEAPAIVAETSEADLAVPSYVAHINRQKYTLPPGTRAPQRRRSSVSNSLLTWQRPNESVSCSEPARWAIGA